jgi:hypothetical protein
MLWSRSVTCAVCSVAVPKAQARRTLERGSAFVCRTCYERWQRLGRICGKCHAAVDTPQPPGLFVGEGMLGHADCGASFLAA